MTIRTLRLCLAIVLALCLPALSYGATLNVPSAYPTIQSAVDASHDGDTVLVADGTYSIEGDRDIDFHGKNITVTSKNGATKTVIDCQGSASTPHRGFLFHQGETSTAKVDGFTITNGYAPADTYGFYGYKAGGGIVISDSSPTIVHCLFVGDMASGNGNGIYANNAGSKISDCNFIDSGIAIFFSGSFAISNCTLKGKSAYGLEMQNSGGTITNCAFLSTDPYAVDVIVSNGQAVMENDTFGGGGSVNPGDLMFEDYGNATITNCIFWGRVQNQPEIFKDGSSNVSITFSDIQGGYAGTGNIDADPLFVSPPSTSHLFVKTASIVHGVLPSFVSRPSIDLHLTAGSPCLGKGTPNGAPATDLDGNSRPNPPSMGAYELIFDLATKVHLKDDHENEVAGIVCDNLSGMADSSAIKDKLAISLDFPAVTGLTGTVTAAGPNTNDTGYVKTLSDGKTYYIPPDEYNENQAAQNVAVDVTKPATRVVLLTLRFSSQGTPYVINREVILARPPVVLVHGINNNPSRWQEFISAISGTQGIQFPFVTVNHCDPSRYGSKNFANYTNPDGKKVNFRSSDGKGWMYNGNEPIEVGALLLSQRIWQTLNQIRGGKLISDEDMNDATDVVNTFAYVNPNAPTGGIPKLAIMRVDVVAWSYGGMITRWYIGSGADQFQPSAPSLGWYKPIEGNTLTTVAYTTPTGSSSEDFTQDTPSVVYQQDIRKVITLGSMWRGVPLANYLNEVLFSKNNTFGLYNAPLLAYQFLFSGLATIGEGVEKVVGSKIGVKVPSMQALAVNSPWLTQLIYGGDPFQQRTLATPHPFSNDISYGAVAGDNNSYPVWDMNIFGLDPTIYIDPYTTTNVLQSPSWFSELSLERRSGEHNYSDGLVPLWSSSIPGTIPSTRMPVTLIAPSSHNAYAGDAATQDYVIRWLNNANLPTGATLNGQWSMAVPSAPPVTSWSFAPSMMAPPTENDLYKQIDGLGRINPGAILNLLYQNQQGRPNVSIVKASGQPSFGPTGLTFPLVASNTGTPAYRIQITKITFSQSLLQSNPLPYILFPAPAPFDLGGTEPNTKTFTVSVSSLSGFKTPTLFCKMSYQYYDQSNELCQSITIAIRLK